MEGNPFLETYDSEYVQAVFKAVVYMLFTTGIILSPPRLCLMAILLSIRTTR